jgi:hypothetical protein
MAADQEPTGLKIAVSAFISIAERVELLPGWERRLR